MDLQQKMSSLDLESKKKDGDLYIVRQNLQRLWDVLPHVDQQQWSKPRDGRLGFLKFYLALKVQFSLPLMGISGSGNA